MPADTIQVSQTKVYIVRHAETEHNKQKIIQGHLDIILNSEGERQADLVATALKDIPFDVAYSSNLMRATDTAKRILVNHSGVEVQTHMAIRERYMGDLQGRVWEKDGGQILKKSKGEMVEPESPQSVRERAVKWWNETIVGTTASYVLIVSHAAWIRVLVQGLLEDRSISAGLGVTVGRCLNTGVSIVSIPRGEKGGGELLQYGNIAHLREVDLLHAAEENGDEKGIP